jgi:hypothetical protein
MQLGQCIRIWIQGGKNVPRKRKKEVVDVLLVVLESNERRNIRYELPGTFYKLQILNLALGLDPDSQNSLDPYSIWITNMSQNLDSSDPGSGSGYIVSGVATPVVFIRS